MLELGFDPITLQWQIILPALHSATVVHVCFSVAVYTQVCVQLTPLDVSNRHWKVS